MKRVLALFAALVVSASAVEYRAVFDCSADDARYILSRMNLIEKTAAMLEARGDDALTCSRSWMNSRRLKAGCCGRGSATF